MKTKLISQSNWPTFFDRFSQHYDSWLVTLEILGSEVGAQVAEEKLEFAGITVERGDKQGDSLIVMIGAKAGNHITHTISRPQEVSLEQTDDGVDVALAIKSDDGTTALLRMQEPMLPEKMKSELPARLRA